MSFSNIEFPRARIAREHGVLVVSQWTAQDFYPPPNTYLIRIKGANPTGINEFVELKYEDEYVKILKLDFDDMDEARSKHDRIMTEADAVAIVDFFKEVKPLVTEAAPALFMVHCQGGISRSSAVAVGYAYYRGSKELDAAIYAAKCFIPNRKVFSLIKAEVDRRLS